MKEEKSNIDSPILKAILLVLLVASFALFGQPHGNTADHQIVKIELNSLHQPAAEAIAVALPRIPSQEHGWTFGANEGFMPLNHLVFNNFYCQLNLIQKQKYFQDLFLSFKQKLEKEAFAVYHIQSKETLVSYSA